MKPIDIRGKKGTTKPMREMVDKKHEKLSVLYKVAYPTSKVEIELADKERREVLTTINPLVKEWEEANKTTYVFLTLEVYLMLEMAYSMGFDDFESCAAAKITRKKFNKMLEKYPLLGEKIDMWKQNPVLLAKSVVMNKIAEGNLYAAQWWLERRKKEEFSQSTKMEITSTETKRLETKVTVEQIEDIRNKIPIKIDGLISNSADNKSIDLEVIEDK